MRRVGFSEAAGLAALLAASICVTNAAEVDSPGFLKAEIYENIPGDSVQLLYENTNFVARTPSRTVYLPGLSFGEPSFTNTFGENLGVVISGVLTAPEAADYYFFIRSDNASQFFLNPSGPEIPDPLTGENGGIAVAEEPGCCQPFREPGAIQTSFAPLSLSTNGHGFLFVVKESTGPDWGQVAMRRLGDPTRAHRLQPLRGIVTGRAESTGASVTVTQPPADLTVEENQEATFAVAAQGVSPLSEDIVYQWFRNDVAILGANSSNYSIAFPKMADDGAQFSVMVAVAGASTNTAKATLTVTPDETAPVVTKVTGSDIFTRVSIDFSEPMAESRATNAANYSIPGLSVREARLVNPLTVRLTTSLQEEAQEYTLTVTNLIDTAEIPNLLISTNNIRKFNSFKFTPGVVKWEAFADVGGGTVEDVALLPEVLEDNPSEIRTLAAFEGPADVEADFGGRLTALLIPPASGDYVFFWASTETGSLRLSPDESGDNKAEIAREPFGAAGRAWQTQEEDGTGRDVLSPENRSSVVPLVGGRRYFIEGLYKDGTGAATWKLDGQADPANGAAPLGGAQVGWFVEPEDADPDGPRFTSITLSGTNLVLEWAGTGTVQVADSLAGPWTDLPGGSPLTVPVDGASKFFRFKP